MESHLVLKLRFPWKGDKIIGIWFWKDNFKSLVVKLFGDENALYIATQNQLLRDIIMVSHSFFGPRQFFWNIYGSFFTLFLRTQLHSWVKFCWKFQKFLLPALQLLFSSLTVQLTFTCSNSTIEMVEIGVKYVQS